LPLRLLWDLDARISPTLKGLCPLGRVEAGNIPAFNTGATALRLIDPISLSSQRSRSGNVGLEDGTALRLIPLRKSDLPTFNWRTAIAINPLTRAVGFAHDKPLY